MIKIDIWEDDLPEEIMERLAGRLCELGIIVKLIDESKNEDELIVKSYQFFLAEILPETP